MSEPVCPDCLCHCPGCAESSSLRERLATAEAERDLWKQGREVADHHRIELAARVRAALADAASLREQLAKPENWPIEALNESNALYGQARTAERERDAARERVTRAEALLVALVQSYDVAPNKCDGLCGSTPGAGCLPADIARARAFLAPTEPDGASGTKETPE